MKKLSLFKMKVFEYHREANDERLNWGQRPILLAEYVKRYRWWLRTRFRKEQDVERKR